MGLQCLPEIFEKRRDCTKHKSVFTFGLGCGDLVEELLHREGFCYVPAFQVLREKYKHVERLLNIYIRLYAVLQVKVENVKMSHLSSLVAQVHPLWCGKVHSFRHTVATAHPGHERTGEDHHELPALLDRTVDLYPLTTKHLWRNLEKYTLLSSLYKSITCNKQCQQTYKKVLLFLFTISYHNILLQHFQSRRAVGL